MHMIIANETEQIMNNKFSKATDNLSRNTHKNALFS